MVLDARTLSARLNELANDQEQIVLAKVASTNAGWAAATIIEAARVLDYEGVLQSSDDPDQRLGYPDFDLINRGWNLLVAELLPALRLAQGVAMQESTPATRSAMRSLLRGFGIVALLRAAADMAYHGLLEQVDNPTKFELAMTLSQTSDHYLDQTESDALDSVIERIASGAGEGDADLMTAEEARTMILSFVRPFDTGHGRMVGYDADPNLDAHFLALVNDRIMRWGNEAGMHPEANVDKIDIVRATAVIGLYTMVYFKHIHMVSLGAESLENINVPMSLTHWKTAHDLVEAISEYCEWSYEQTEKVVHSLTVTHADAEYFRKEAKPFIPMFLEIGQGYLLCPVSSTFSNPFEAFRMFQEWKAPSIVRPIKDKREGMMVADLNELFPGTRYQKLTKPARIKRGSNPVTDIDGAILDMNTGELALFQLKWQDFGSNSLKKTRSRAKNFVDETGDWVSKVSKWIADYGEATLCTALRFKIPRGQTLTAIRYFAIGRTNARFASYGFQKADSVLAVSTFPQFARLRLEVGPAPKVFAELHRRVIGEEAREIIRLPIPHIISVGDQEIVFSDLWSMAPIEGPL